MQLVAAPALEEFECVFAEAEGVAEAPEVREALEDGDAEVLGVAGEGGGAAA